MFHHCREDDSLMDKYISLAHFCKQFDELLWELNVAEWVVAYQKIYFMEYYKHRCITKNQIKTKP